MSCSMEVNSNTIELTVHTSCYWVLDLLCVIFKNIDSFAGTHKEDDEKVYHAYYQWVPLVLALQVNFEMAKILK